MSAIATIAASGLSQIAVPVALAVGHMNHASALFGIYVVDADKEGINKLEAIQAIANAGLSYVEFSAQFKKACEMADTADKANGFVKPEGAKGAENYGPKRRLLNQRGSEAKRLFAAYKRFPEQMVELGYWGALEKARSVLEETGRTWDDEKALDKDEKAAKQAGKVRTLARAQAMDAAPQKKDESDEDYLIRVRELMAAAVDEAETEEFNKGVKSLYDSLMKKHNANMLAGVFQMMLENMDTESLEATQAWIQEEIVCRIVETK